MAHISVTFHSKKPTFFDTIKMLIPANLNAFHHLLFLFYHVNAEQKKGFDTMEVRRTCSFVRSLQLVHQSHQPTYALQTLIGYTTLPILEDCKRLLSNTQHQLPIAQGAISQYISSAESNATLKVCSRSFARFAYAQAGRYSHLSRCSGSITRSRHLPSLPSRTRRYSRKIRT